jgi:hypothetical protein
MVLTAPWSGMSPILAIPGVFLNALALWVVGTVAEKIIRS